MVPSVYRAKWKAALVVTVLPMTMARQGARRFYGVDLYLWQDGARKAELLSKRDQR